MAESQEEDEGISTVNTNVHVVKDQRQVDWEDGERMIILRDVHNLTDLVVMSNRINDEYGGITGLDYVNEDIVIVYCDRR